jgi:hypothetical protein
MYFWRATISCVNRISGASADASAAMAGAVVSDAEDEGPALGSTGSAGSEGGEGRPDDEVGDAIRNERSGVIPVKPPRPSDSIRAQAAGS